MSYHLFDNVHNKTPITKKQTQMLLNYVIIIIATAPKISYFSPAECSYRSNIHMYNRKNMQLIFFKSDSVKNNQ